MYVPQEDEQIARIKAPTDAALGLAVQLNAELEVLGTELYNAYYCTNMGFAEDLRNPVADGLDHVLQLIANLRELKSRVLQTGIIDKKGQE